MKIQEVPTFELEDGTVLHDLEQAYTLQGELNERGDNLVVIFHALTGGPRPEEWWEGVVGPGTPLDPNEFAILTPNLLGSCYGTTWQRTEGPNLRPQITTRDMARLVRLLVDSLRVERVALAVGGSLGGMIALEWAATFPELTRETVVFAAPAAHTAQAIAWNHVQREAVELGGAAGLRLARKIAMISYRTAAEFQERFGRRPQGDGRFQIQSYLDHHGDKLLERFEIQSYLRLLDAMDLHDIGRGRGGSVAALSHFQGRLTGVGIPGDLLYSDADVRAWTDPVGAEYRTIESPHGHDAFLIEIEQVNEILEGVLDRVRGRRAHRERGAQTVPMTL